jgi:DnaK suppressor protein
MDDSRMTEFREIIAARLAEIVGEDARGRDGQAVVELDQQAVGRLSRMDALQNQAMAKAQQARRDSETTRLRAALQRLDDGTYGACEECGEDIPIGRLKLDLAARRCVSCAAS